MIACAICVGTVSTFCAPIGGVIFAIELTSSYYMVGTLWKSFFSATICMIVMKLLYFLPFITLMKHTEFEVIHINYEIIFYSILAVICAGMAGLFNHVLTKFIFLRTKLKNPFVSDRWKFCMSVGIFIAVISYPVKFMRISEKRLCEQMFSTGEVSVLSDGGLWTHPQYIFNMIIYCVLKFIFIILDVSCPIVNGIFAPVFSLGAVMGRLYGHILRQIGWYFGVELIRYEGIYALVGATALGGAVTKTVSVAMIVFEMTG